MPTIYFEFRLTSEDFDWYAAMFFNARFIKERSLWNHSHIYQWWDIIFFISLCIMIYWVEPKEFDAGTWSVNTVNVIGAIILVFTKWIPLGLYLGAITKCTHIAVSTVYWHYISWRFMSHICGNTSFERLISIVNSRDNLRYHTPSALDNKKWTIPRRGWLHTKRSSVHIVSNSCNSSLAEPDKFS